MGNFIWNILVIALLIYFMRKVQKNFQNMRRAYLVKISVQFDHKKLTEDFVADYSQEEKERFKTSLEKPFIFTLYRESFAYADILFKENGQVGVSLYEECFKRKPQDVLDTGVLRMFPENGCIVCELVDEGKTDGMFRRVFQFPFYVLNEFLKKAIGYGELKKLPEFLDDFLKKHDFQVANIALKDTQSFSAYGAEWFSEDSEISSDYHWNRFRSKYVTVSLIYFPFSADQVSLFEANLIHRSLYSEEKYEHDFFGLAQKVRALKEKP